MEATVKAMRSALEVILGLKNQARPGTLEHREHEIAKEVLKREAEILLMPPIVQKAMEILRIRPSLTEKCLALSTLVREQSVHQAQQRAENAEKGWRVDRHSGKHFAMLFDKIGTWSAATFGPGRVAGVIDHVEKELAEIKAKPNDLEEWIDLAMLAMDGARRACGITGDGWVEALMAKFAKNQHRTWPDWRTAPKDKAIEHERKPEDPGRRVGIPTHAWQEAFGVKSAIAARAADEDAERQADIPVVKSTLPRAATEAGPYLVQIVATERDRATRAVRAWEDAMREAAGLDPSVAVEPQDIVEAIKLYTIAGINTKYIPRSQRIAKAAAIPGMSPTMIKKVCNACGNTGKELIDCEGSAGYRPCSQGCRVGD